MGKKIGLLPRQIRGAIDVMTFIQNNDIDSAELDTNAELKTEMVKFHSENIFINLNDKKMK